MQPVTEAPRRLGHDFFDRDPQVVARDLLGKRLVSLIGGVRVAGDIVECEAYGPGDSTSHSFRGATARNRSMFAHPGTAYVYFTYGMHFCMNLTTESHGVGSAVLVRALAPREGIEAMRARRGEHRATRDLCRGPGRLCAALGIVRAVDGIDTCATDAQVFVEDAPAVPPGRIARTARVGVRGAPPDVAARQRFVMRDEPFASGPRIARR
ncbi:MAG: DNA-3-methyladenine glycosylase [Deltaproteobacteria bacterium]